MTDLLLLEVGEERGDFEFFSEDRGRSSSLDDSDDVLERDIVIYECSCTVVSIQYFDSND